MVLFILNCSLNSIFYQLYILKRAVNLLFIENQFHSIKEVVCTFHGFVFKTDKKLLQILCGISL